MEALARRLLQEAAQRIGGSELLAKHLGASTSALQQWMNGKDVPPAEIFHKALDLLLDDKPCRFTASAGNLRR
jgi:transcriptional regulator with XRE-family HTH domain